MAGHITHGVHACGPACQPRPPRLPARISESRTARLATLMPVDFRYVSERELFEDAMTSRYLVPCVVSLLLLTACSPGAIQRPLDGAPVGGGPVSGRPEIATPDSAGPPPTLSPFTQTAGGSPVPESPGPPAPSPSPSPLPGEAGFIIVATDGAGANLRDGPSTGARVLRTLAEGTAVEVLGEPVTVEGRSWRQIRGGGHEGWVVAVVVRRR